MPDPTDRRPSREQQPQSNRNQPANPPGNRQSQRRTAQQPWCQPQRSRQPPGRQPAGQQPQSRQPPGQQASRQGAPAQTSQGSQHLPSDVQFVEDGERFVHVRFADPDAFEDIRTPDWASHAADSVYRGAEVRTGRRRGSNDWSTQSVLVPKPVDQGTALSVARQVREKIGE